MDYNSAENQYYRPYNPQYPQPQIQAAATYDPSQVQAYYSYNQQQQEQYQYYPSQGYAAASYPQQYQQDSTSIHPPGVPITPDPTPFQDQHNAYYRHGVVESLSQQQSFPTQYAAHGSVQARGGHFGYRGRGRRGGRPFRGAGRGRFGQHGPRLKGTPAQASLTTPAQGSTAPVNPPPPRMAWCELCRVDCNTPEILEQHKNGKRHKKNLQKHEELQKFNNFITEQQNVQNPSSDVQPSQAIQPEKVEGSGGKQDSFPSQALVVTNNNSNETEAPKKEYNPEASTVNLPEEPHRNSRDGQYQSRGRGLKRKMRGGRGGKYVRTNEGFKKPIDLPKPKEAIPLICELCNVKCESQVVLQSHLAGKKHLANVKRYNGHQALYGEAGLQELYPSSFNNPSSSPSIVPQGQQGVSSDPQIVLAQLLTYVLAQAQAQAQAFSVVSPQRDRLFTPLLSTSISISNKRSFTFTAMDASKASPEQEMPSGLDSTTEEEYASQSKLLQEFIDICSIDKAWTFNSSNGGGKQALFSVSQPNLLANKKRKFMLSAAISKENKNSVTLQWAPFPVEMTGASAFVPSPSGSKLLVVRNPENDSPTQFEIWSQSQLEKEFHVPQTIHGSVYTDGWFEGISWNSDETLIAYVAEEPYTLKPTFGPSYKKGGSSDKDLHSWKGQGDWEENWGETYAGKRQPSLFVIDVNSGEVQAVEGIPRSLSVGQVVWAPSTEGTYQYLVFVGWTSDTRKLGMKYCYNRPCALYVARISNSKSEVNEPELKERSEDWHVVSLTQSISSAFFPRFSPDGKSLVFLSAKSSVDSGAHSATNSLHRIDLPANRKLSSSDTIVDVIPVVQCAADGCFPGLYCSSILSNPWLSDGCTMILPSIWGSCQTLIAVNVFSGEVLRISPTASNFSWNILTLDGDNIIAVSSSPVDVPQIKYGYVVENANEKDKWNWLNVSSPIFKCPEKVKSLLSSLQFSIMKIPVKDVSNDLPEGAKKPIEAIFVSSNSKKEGECDPLIVVLHGGPHSVSLSSFSKSLGFLSSIGYSLLIVNYRGSLGFGEEALQSLPGKVGSQDVNDVLTAVDHVIDMGLASPTKITVLGGSHGGFLTTHLIGQAPNKFVAAAARNPVCNLALMVGTTDIPDWCYVESYGSQGKVNFTESPSVEDLAHFYSKSPISHLSKVKTPVLFLLGAQDLRVPVSNGLQYARALKEKGVEVKIIVFPNDVHGIDRPQSDFESFLNIGLWFKKYCK